MTSSRPAIRPPASGLPTGKRQHTPLIITKELDAASAPLHAVQASNENLKEWELLFYRPSATGGEQQHFTIRLTNASGLPRSTCGCRTTSTPT